MKQIIKVYNCRTYTFTKVYDFLDLYLCYGTCIWLLGLIFVPRCILELFLLRYMTAWIYYLCQSICLHGPILVPKNMIARTYTCSKMYDYLDLYQYLYQIVWLFGPILMPQYMFAWRLPWPNIVSYFVYTDGKIEWRKNDIDKLDFLMDGLFLNNCYIQQDRC